MLNARRLLCPLIGCLLALAALSPSPVRADSSSFGDFSTFLRQFSHPSDRAVQPRVQWWWPGSEVDPAELRRELDEIADAGFGGVEIVDVVNRRLDSVEAVAGEETVRQRWIDAGGATLHAAANRNLSVDLIPGPHGDSVSLSAPVNTANPLPVARLWPASARPVSLPPHRETMGSRPDVARFQALRTQMDMGSGEGRDGVLPAVAGETSKGLSTQWTVDLLPAINRLFALGVNRISLAGYAYAMAPGAEWPGYRPFDPMGAGVWNSQQPVWRHIGDLSGYLSRTQLVLRQGHNKTDVALLDSEADHDGTALDLSALTRTGFSVGRLDPVLLTLPSAQVSGGRLASSGPAFKALVVQVNRPLSAQTLVSLKGFARHCLPIVLLGHPPEKGELSSLHRALAALKRCPSVFEAETVEELPAVLAKAGLVPAVQPATSGPLRSVYRATDTADFYYLVNVGDHPVQTTVDVAASGVPYDLNAWTGAIMHLVDYRVDRGRMTLPVSLQPGQARILAVWHEDLREVHVVSATATPLFVSPDRVGVRVDKAGPVSLTLSDGTMVMSAGPAVPRRVDLTTWLLRVDSFVPGVQPDRSKHYLHGDIGMVTLLPWPQIPAIAHDSGVGNYHCSFPLPKDWPRQAGAMLHMDIHRDTVRIRVNGQFIGPVDQLARQVDLGKLLQPGENSIDVEVATPLTNQILHLREAQDQNQKQTLPLAPQTPLDSGLWGHVWIAPYVDITLPRLEKSEHIGADPVIRH